MAKTRAAGPFLLALYVEPSVLMFEQATAFIYVYTVDWYNVVIQNCICMIIHFTGDDCDDSYLYYTSKVTAGRNTSSGYSHVH